MRPQQSSPSKNWHLVGSLALALGFILFFIAWGQPGLRAAIIQWFPVWFTAINLTLMGIIGARIKRAEDVWSRIRILRKSGASFIVVGAAAVGPIILLPVPVPPMDLWAGLLILSEGLVFVLMAVLLHSRIRSGAA
jgi:hypothetical protein